MELLSTLAEQGLTALLLAISIFINFYLYREVRDLQNKRIEDIKESREQIVEPLRAVKSTVESILGIIANAKATR